MGDVLVEEAVVVEESAKQVVVVIQMVSAVEELVDEMCTEEIVLEVASGLAVVALAVMVVCVIPAQKQALLYSEG